MPIYCFRCACGAAQEHYYKRFNPPRFVQCACGGEALRDLCAEKPVVQTDDAYRFTPYDDMGAGRRFETWKQVKDYQAEQAAQGHEVEPVPARRMISRIEEAIHRCEKRELPRMSKKDRDEHFRQVDKQVQKDVYDDRKISA